VIIDPGHGGSKPGVCSRCGLKEKDIALKISRMVADEINSRPGFRAIMTREGDYDVGLARRIEIARSHGGECFVSVHVDGFENRRVRGSDVYFLSLDGATDKSAERVAERENFLLELGEERDLMVDDVQNILLDLTESDVMYRSSQLAEKVAARMNQGSPIPFRGVKQASFVVLKSIAMPSILVETAFLSNSTDIRLLRRPEVLKKIADSIAQGVIDFLRSTAPLMAERKSENLTYFSHTVARGETLWSIARRYGLAIDRLRSINQLEKHSTIFPGQKLTVYRKK
jgi:N-acetylmuramoyl-L-alanine amidase